MSQTDPSVDGGGNAAAIALIVVVLLVLVLIFLWISGVFSPAHPAVQSLLQHLT